MIEVGLGGRLDATNIVEPEVSVITSIGLDHCDMLGDTLEQIAAEKAGIIKPERPVVIGRMPRAAEAVIRKIAAERGSPLVSVAEEFGEDTGNYPWTNLEGRLPALERGHGHPGRAAARCPLAPDRETVARGLGAVDWPGRWQRSAVGGRTVILDSSHNPEGAGVLDMNLARLVRETGRRPVIITGALGARRAGALLETAARHARRTSSGGAHQARACSFEELETLIPRGFSGPVVRATVEGLFPGPDAAPPAVRTISWS